MYIGPWQELKLGQIIADNKRLLQETVSQQLHIVRQQRIIQQQVRQQQQQQQQHDPQPQPVSPSLPAARQPQLAPASFASSSDPPWPAPASDAYSHSHHSSDPLVLPGSLLPPLTSHSPRRRTRGRPGSGDDFSSQGSRREKRTNRSSRAVTENVAEERRQHLQRLREMYGLTSGDARAKESEEEKMQDAQPPAAQPAAQQRSRIIQPLRHTANHSPVPPGRTVLPAPFAAAAAADAHMHERDSPGTLRDRSTALSASDSFSFASQARDSLSLTTAVSSPQLASSSPVLSESSPGGVRPLPALSLSVPVDSELSYLSSHGIDSQRAVRYLSHGRVDSMAVHNTQVALLQSSVPLGSREEEERVEDWAGVSGIVMRPVTRAALQLPSPLTDDWTRAEKEEEAAMAAKSAAEQEMALIQRVVALLAPAAAAAAPSSPPTVAATLSHCQSLLAQLRSSASLSSSPAPSLLASIGHLDHYIALLQQQSAAAAVTAPVAASDDEEEEDGEEAKGGDRQRLDRAAFRLEEALKRRESEVKSSWKDVARAMTRVREEKQELELRIQETVRLRTRSASSGSAAGRELPSSIASSTFSSPLPVSQPAAQPVSDSPAVKLSSGAAEQASSSSSSSVLLPPILSSPSQSVTTVISINPRYSTLQLTPAASPSSSRSLFHRASGSASPPPPPRRSVELSHRARGSSEHLQPIDVTRGDADTDDDGDGLSSAALNAMDDEVEKVLQFVQTAATDWH